MTKQIISASKIIALSVVLSFGLSYVYAWTAPSGTPPTGNVSAPINTGDNTQYKAGNLVLNDSISPFVNGLIVRYGGIGIGTANTNGYPLRICSGSACAHYEPVSVTTRTTLGESPTIPVAPTPVTYLGVSYSLVYPSCTTGMQGTYYYRYYYYNENGNYFYSVCNTVTTLTYVTE